MSLRFRRSMKLMPGVRLNFSKSTVGMSFGVPGARYTINSKGRRTLSTGIPGTGLYNVETLSSGKRSSRAQQAEEFSAQPEISPGKPGLFAKKSEREFYKFILDIYNADEPDTTSQIVDKATALKTKFPTLQIPLDLIIFLHAATEDNFESRIETLGQPIWDDLENHFIHPIVKKYFVGILPQISVTTGITTRDFYNKQTFCFIWSEVLQSLGKLDQALAVVNAMYPTQVTAISLADLEIALKDYDAAIETTEDIENEDDATAMLLVLRGVAFREKEQYEASLECSKRAIAKKDREERLIHRARFERAETYERMGKRAMAIKDLEKILVDDSDYPQVAERLASLNA